MKPSCGNPRERTCDGLQRQAPEGSGLEAITSDLYKGIAPGISVPGCTSSTATVVTDCASNSAFVATGFEWKPKAKLHVEQPVNSGALDPAMTKDTIQELRAFFGRSV